MIIQQSIKKIKGSVRLPSKWVVFAPVLGAQAPLHLDEIKVIPDVIKSGDKNIQACEITPTRCQYDFKEYFGAPPYGEKKHTAYIFLPLCAETKQVATFGFGADWYLEAWLNGNCILDTTEKGNRRCPPLIDDYCVNAPVNPGENLLAIRFLCGKAGAVLAIGGPEELRGGDYSSILPDTRTMDTAALYENSPPDPAAPIKWVPPDGFDPRIAGLGLPPLDAAEHVEVFHSLPSNVSLDDGGSGVYESVRHGTFNHNVDVLPFRDRLLAVWTNHAIDEGGYGSRRLACAGKIIDTYGNIDWQGEAYLAEVTTAPVPVRRRKRVSDQDAVRGVEALGVFRVINDRLFFFGTLGAMHGVTTADAREKSKRRADEPVLEKNYFFAKRTQPPRGRYISWLIGSYFQEWDIINDRFQPVSPVYKALEFPTAITLTPKITLPLETLSPVYRDAPLLTEAPEDFQMHVGSGCGIPPYGSTFFPPGPSNMAHDGQNGIYLPHSTEFKRPDGSLVLILENTSQKNFYYAAARMNTESYYPLPRRTSLYGSVKPNSGVLDDGTVYVIANSPNRQNMFITVSHDGRLFDKTWLLLHQSLANNTPGMHKSQGGGGSGPQYFKSAVVGECVWIVYSIGKEHIGASKVPVSAILPGNGY
ncbi:MAG: hypothetical protein LC725_07895 [Lentisphaerae bacterium]|nr:hypothetical protein [Lentisphaerota bacterium]